jgi:YggT family protein
MNPFIFLIDILFQLYATALLIRLLLQWVHADFYNPVSQFIVKITNPPVLPLRKIIPGFGGIDVSTLLLAFIILAIKIMLVYQTIDPFAVGILAFGETLLLIIRIFFYSIIIQAILSWVNPDPYNPAVSLLNSLTHPILKIFRKFIPPVGGMDLSPMVAIIALMFVQYSLSYVFAMVFGISL